MRIYNKDTRVRERFKGRVFFMGFIEIIGAIETIEAIEAIEAIETIETMETIEAIDYIEGIVCLKPRVSSVSFPCSSPASLLSRPGWRSG